MFRIDSSTSRRSCDPRCATAKASCACPSRPCNSALLQVAASKRETSFIVSSFVSRRPRTTQGLSAPAHIIGPEKALMVRVRIETQKAGYAGNASALRSGHLRKRGRIENGLIGRATGLAFARPLPRGHGLCFRYGISPEGCWRRAAVMPSRGWLRIAANFSAPVPLIPLVCGWLASGCPKSLAGRGSVFNGLPAPPGFASRVDHEARAFASGLTGGR